MKKRLLYDAAKLVAQGRLSDTKIASKVGISERTLYNWKNDPEFTALVETLLNVWHQHVMDTGIADARRRMFRLNDRWRRAQSVIEQRAKDENLKKVPGGNTGLMVRRVRAVAGRPVAEYVVDVGLMAEMDRMEELAAKQLGQFAVKHEHTGPGGRPIQMNVSARDLLLSRLDRLAAAEPAAQPDREPN